MMGPRPSKMAKIDPLSAGADLLNLIALITDKDAVLSRLNEIEAYTKQANEAVERVAKAEELEDLLNEAMATSAAIEAEQAKAKESSANVITEASAIAAEIVAAAEAEAENLKAEAAREVAALEAEASKHRSSLIQAAQETKDDADALKAEFEKKLKEVNETKMSLSQLKADLSVKGKELEEKSIELTNRENEVTRKESILRQL